MKWSGSHSPTQSRGEFSCIGAVWYEDHAGLGTKLSCAKRKGSVQSGSNLFCVLLERARQNKNRIGAAHLSVKRNRFRTGRSDIHQNSARSARACESPSLNQRMF